MIRFRKQAIQSLQSPEALDDPLPLLRSSSWAILAALLISSTALLIWSILGRVPVRIQGRGILLRPMSLIPIQSRGNGPIAEILVREGDCVRRDQIMARLDLVELKLKLEASKRRLAQLQRQNMLADIQAGREISLVQADLKRLLPYRNSGAIPEQTFVDKEREIERLQTQQLLEANQRVQASNDELLQLNKDQAELNKSSFIRAPISGCIVDQLLLPGSIITSGTTVFWLERNDSRSELVSYAYFPSKDGKRLRVGQSVRVTPTTTKAQRHGGIQGKILKIRPLPVTKEGLMQRFGFQSLVEAIQNTDKNQATDEPQIEVITTLNRSQHTFSGFDWGGGTGPRIELSPGTITEVSVLVEDRQPISYVIPLLRDLSGIY